MEDVRSKILHAQDRPTKEVDVSEFWPEVGKVHIGVMSGTDRDSWERLISGGGPLIGPFLVRSIFDAETNARIFKDEDADALGAKNWLALDKLWGEARALNQVTKAAQDLIEKNSEAPAGNGS